MEGTRIGAYRVIRKLADGGMGTVFLAERADGQFEQQVALKVIRRGMDSSEILRRFESERRILARLAHPNIGRLFDGGVTPDGLPYFTMEYVDGKPIDVYCRENDLSIDEHLALFETICEAVEYAQRNLVIHRDLKPGNILVTEAGEVKLLDFGIAKLIDDEGAEATRTGAHVMTPDYASPEQVRGEPVTTATDVYALGVILYELLSGERPYSVNKATPHALEAAILETQPPRPSAARTDAHRRRLRGDLDNICLVALRKEPDRRYSSAESLLRDIRRYRAGHTVRARPDTVAYRVQKFVRRNLAAVATTVIVLGVLAGMAVFYSVRVSGERDRARMAAAKSAVVSDFIISLFQVADPNESAGETVTARSLLDRGAARIESELAGQPEVQAQMLYVVGKVYYALGLHEEAIALLDRSREIGSRALGSGERDVLMASILLGDVLRWSGDKERAEPILRDALETAESSLGPADPLVGQAMNNLAILLAERGDYAGSEQLYRAAIDIWQRHDDEDSRKLAAVGTNNLALAIHEQGRHAEAREMFDLALERQLPIFGDVHPEIATTLYNYAALLRDMGDWEGAEEMGRRVLAMDRELLGPDHPDVAYSMVSLGVLLRSRGDYDGARDLLEEALALRLRTLGPDHQNTAYSASSVGRLYEEIGDFAKAESLYYYSMEIHKRVNGERHTAVAVRLDNLGSVAWERGEFARAEALHREARAIKEEAIGPRAPTIPISEMQMARAMAWQGRLQEADSLHRHAMEMTRDIRGAEYVGLSNHMMALAAVLLPEGRLAEADSLCGAALVMRERDFRDDDIRVANARMALARVLFAEGEYENAVALYRDALEVASRILPQGHYKLGEFAVGYGAALYRNGDWAAGEEAMARGLALLATLPEASPRRTRAMEAYNECMAMR